MTSNIKHSIFDGFFGSTAGGALNITGLSLKLSDNIFTNCAASHEGGAIYINKCHIELKCSIFLKCYVSNHANANLGNAFKIDYSTVSCNSLSILQCGVDDTKSGDSATYIIGSKEEITNLNFSSNYGVNGASMISSESTVDGSIHRFILGADGHDENLIEARYKLIQFDYCSLLDGSNGIYMFYIMSTTITLTNCILFNSHQSLKRSTGTISFINCSSDIKYDGYTFTNINKSTISICLPKENVNHYSCKFQYEYYQMKLQIAAFIVMFL